MPMQPAWNTHGAMIMLENIADVLAIKREHYDDLFWSSVEERLQIKEIFSSQISATEPIAAMYMAAMKIVTGEGGKEQFSPNSTGHAQVQAAAFRLVWGVQRHSRDIFESREW